MKSTKEEIEWTFSFSKEFIAFKIPKNNKSFERSFKMRETESIA
jgi:hypothetical protein